MLYDIRGQYCEGLEMVILAEYQIITWTII